MSKQDQEHDNPLKKDQEHVLIPIDKDFGGFIKRHKKHILNSSLSIGIGVLFAFFWAYVLVGIISFVVGYCFRYYYVFNKESEEPKE